MTTQSDPESQTQDRAKCQAQDPSKQPSLNISPGTFKTFYCDLNFLPSSFWWIQWVQATQVNTTLQNTLPRSFCSKYWYFPNRKKLLLLEKQYFEILKWKEVLSIKVQEKIVVIKKPAALRFLSGSYFSCSFRENTQGWGEAFKKHRFI